MTERPRPNLDIVIDCADPAALADFWAAALGYRKAGGKDAYFLLLPDQRAHPPVLLQAVPEPKQGKARIHIDLRVADVETEARRLETLGGRRIDVGQGPVSAQFWRLARRIGKKKAAIAVGHSILVIGWSLLTNNCDYDDLGGDYFTKRAKPDRQRDRLIAQLHELGYHVTLKPAA